MSDWLCALAEATAASRPAVLVTVAAARGSVPRPAGTHMVVLREGVDGTIGGGHLEFQAIAIARDLIAGPAAAARLTRFPLGASLGQCCGGVVTLLFEPIGGDVAWVAHAADLRRRRVPCVTVVPTRGDAIHGRLVVSADDVFGRGAAEQDDLVAFARGVLQGRGGAQLGPAADGRDAHFYDPVRDDAFDVVLFGAGHVGRAIARALADLPCRVRWIDTRDDAFPPEVPGNATALATDAPEAEVDAAPSDAFFLVMTHEHAQDERLAERILARGDVAYFGLIGSQSKRRQFEARLARRGMPVERFAAMTCPIGVPGIAGKEPAVIAAAVAAQILQTWTARRARVDEPARAFEPRAAHAKAQARR